MRGQDDWQNDLPGYEKDAGQPDCTEKSRSRKKRESAALQKRGEELAALGLGAWKALPLPEGLLEALKDARAVKSREARRRQMQYVGRLMREAPEEEMNALLSVLDSLQKNR